LSSSTLRFAYVVGVELMQLALGPLLGEGLEGLATGIDA
jgi:hypothetical protein